MSELTNLSAQATSIMTPVHASGSTASGFNSSSHIGVPAATYMGGASVDLSTSACNALPIPSRQLSDATSMQNTSNLFQSRPSAATGANSTTTVGRMRASDNSDQFGDLGFHSNPTLDQVRNMPDPLEESGFYSSPSLEQVLELPIP